MSYLSYYSISFEKITNSILRFCLKSLNCEFKTLMKKHHKIIKFLCVENNYFFFKMSFLEILRYKSHFLRDFLEKWIFFDNYISFIFTRCRDHKDEYSTAGTLFPQVMKHFYNLCLALKIRNTSYLFSILTFLREKLIFFLFFFTSEKICKSTFQVKVGGT